MSSLSIQNFSFLSSLLPYDLSTKANRNLKSALKEYRLLLVATSEAMKALKNGELLQFDAVVGENACQTRAIKIASIAGSSLSEAEELFMQAETTKQKLEDLTSSISFFMKSGISLDRLLEQEGLEISLSSNQLFFIESFILSIVQVIKDSKEKNPLCINGIADPKKLKELESDISGNFAENLLRRARFLLSTASVEFVREEAFLIGDPLLCRMSSDDFTIRYNSWPCIPMFWSYKTLLLSASRQNIPLILSAQHLTSDVESLHCLSRLPLF